VSAVFFFFDPAQGLNVDVAGMLMSQVYLLWLFLVLSSSICGRSLISRLCIESQSDSNSYLINPVISSRGLGSG
jgi:hypothetical protein